ncbi:MAG: 1-acyl-sn-glycerol-3-phosphate acyltransferase [Rhodoferax sp.]|nr:1-acyl-sn-glycerol-3-phosphate acyltransferase [Rhodoferax sp.]
MPALRRRLSASRPLKLLRIAYQFGRAAWLVALRFPHLQQAQRLQEIQRWSQQMLGILQIEVASTPLPPSGFAGLVVSNHVSWLDILVLQSLLPGAFVAKTEVKRWPVVGYLAQACATIFVDRSSPRSARAMVADTAAAIRQGYAVVVFPEGTSSDGRAVGSFHANIFESAIQAQSQVLALSLHYRDPGTGGAAEAAHFTGDMTLLSSIARVTATSNIQALVHLGDCLAAQGHSRKSLALLAQQTIHAQLVSLAYAA